jgi:AraC-like DNA-binding protein
VRLGLVKQQLQSKSLSRATIAYQLGFEDPNSFYRLYRQWVDDGKLS